MSVNSADQAEISHLPSRQTIARVSAGAAVVAAVILFSAVLPAEYGRDPLGLGRLTGIGALWAPPQKIATPVKGEAQTTYLASVPFRSDVIDISLQGATNLSSNNELEYKVHLPKGGSLVYSWEVSGIGHDDFYSEFHGETEAADRSLTVAYYHKMSGTADNGTLIAPFEGRHGWFFQNSAEKPVKVRLRIAGFYTLIPPGEPGNEAGFRGKEITS